VWLLLLVGWLLPNLIMVVAYISIIKANRSALGQQQVSIGIAAGQH